MVCVIFVEGDGIVRIFCESCLICACWTELIYWKMSE